nr:GNAT family N-acetyltransferase [Ignavibacterium sp.]
FMDHHIANDVRFTLRTGASDKWSEQIISAIKDPNTLVLVAQHKTEIIGCAYIIIKSGSLDFGPEKIGYICDVYVDKSYRRLGIAKRFLSEAIAWLKIREIHTLEASWSVHSEEAKKTWPALGFVPISISGQMQFY